MTSRSETTNALLKLTPQMVTDLGEFERFKKWTPEHFSLRFNVTLSTGYRRLQKLGAGQALAVFEGSPLPGGGRQRDIYYLTVLGARMLTRLRDRQSDRVLQPDVSNPIDNTHDLCALEVALRSGCYSTARAFQKRAFGTGRQSLTIVPDVEFVSTDGRDRIYIEVEQTSKPAHIKTKYANYAALMRLWKKPEPLPWLVTVFPDERARRLLCAEHEAAAQSERDKDEAGLFDYNFFWTSLDLLRESDVRSFDGVWKQDMAGVWYPVAKGFMDCTHDLCYRR